MNCRMKIYAVATLLLPIITIVVWYGQQWPYWLFIVWLVVVFLYWLRIERKAYQLQQVQMREAMQLAHNKTINYHRHDWMNDLQVLYGYASLKKHDRGFAYMGQITDKLMVESQIAKLGSPSLISYLYAFRTLPGYMILDVAIEGNIVLDQLLAEWKKFSTALIEIIELYRLLADTTNLTDNRLLFTLKAEEQFVKAQLTYDGQLQDEQQWYEKVNELLQRFGEVIRVEQLQYIDVQLVAERKQ